MSNLGISEQFIELMDRYKKIIYKICHSYCRSHEDKQDLEQEILIQLWRSYSTYNPKFKFTTWMYRVALNVAISHYRKLKTKVDDSTSLEDININKAGDDDNQEERNEVEQLLYQFINELDELNKALMILYLDNNSHKDMSRILGISQSNVATKISRIKNRLKKQFESHKTK